MIAQSNTRRGGPRGPQLAVLALGSLLLAAPALWAQDDPATVRLDDFGETLPAGESPEGWDSRKVAPMLGSGDTYYYRFVHDDGEHYIHLKSGDDNSFTVGREFPFDMKDYPILEWEWKVAGTPEGGDVRVEERDDQAGAVCVVHDPGLIGFESLCYIFENEGPVGAELTSRKRDDSKYIILRSKATDELGTWYHERRNILQDFTRMFGFEPDTESIIGLQIDSNDTESSAEAFYRNIVLKKPGS